MDDAYAMIYAEQSLSLPIIFSHFLLYTSIVLIICIILLFKNKFTLFLISYLYILTIFIQFKFYFYLLSKIHFFLHKLFFSDVNSKRQGRIRHFYILFVNFVKIKGYKKTTLSSLKQENMVSLCSLLDNGPQLHTYTLFVLFFIFFIYYIGFFYEIICNMLILYIFYLSNLLFTCFLKQISNFNSYTHRIYTFSKKNHTLTINL